MFMTNNIGTEYDKKKNIIIIMPKYDMGAN